VKERGRRDDRLVGGFVLVGLGLFLLAVQLVPEVGRLVPLLVGLFLLTLFILRRQYGLLVAGCIVSGVGAGVALQGLVTGPENGGIVVLCLGLGFLAIYLLGLVTRVPEHHWWPFIPGGILTFIGAVILSGRVIDEALRWWPVVLIVIGLAVVGQALVRPRR
jgi:hypothetical protein